MKRFYGYFLSELLKWVSLPTFWYGLVLIAGINVFFIYENTSMIHAITSGDLASVGLDGVDSSLLEQDPASLVGGAVLSSPYQASVFFIPVAVALLAAQEYRFGQHVLTRLLVGSWKSHLIGSVLAAVVGGVIMSLVLIAINGAGLALFLPISLKGLLNPPLVLAAAGRILVVTVAMSLLAQAAVEVTRHAIPALVVVVILFLLSATGVLNAIGPGMSNVLPLIGARSFVFGHTVEGTSQLYGMLLLAAWSIASLLAVFFFGRRSRTWKLKG